MRRALFHLFARVEGERAAAALMAILEAWSDAVSAFEVAAEAGAAGWQVEGYLQRPRLTPQVEVCLALAAASAGGRLLAIGERRLEERDWLAENRLAFPLQRIGRFLIYGSHHGDLPAAGAIPILIDAATAFGTGEHPSTRGCLLMIDRLARRGRPHRVLDLGTGSGILAIAAAKAWRRPVLASDIDPGAVAAARRNSRANGTARQVRVRAAAGYRDREMRCARYDLVLSNILARPLALLARDLGRALMPGGRAILAGLLSRQERVVLSAHRSLGMVLERRLVIDGWSSLLVRKRARFPLRRAGPRS